MVYKRKVEKKVLLRTGSVDPEQVATTNQFPHFLSLLSRKNVPVSIT